MALEFAYPPFRERTRESIFVLMVGKWTYAPTGTADSALLLFLRTLKERTTGNVNA